MIEVCTDDHVFFRQRWIVTRQHAAHVLRANLGKFLTNASAEAHSQAEMRKGSIGVRRIYNLLERVPASGEEFLSAFRIDDHAEGVPGIARCPGAQLQFHARLEAGPCGALPRYLDSFRILN